MTHSGWLRGSLLLSLAAAAWGGMFPVVKTAMDHLDPFGLTLIRYALASLVMLGLLWLLEGRRALASDGRGRQLWIAGTLGFAGFGLLAFLGLGLTRPEHAAVVPALMPLIAIVVDAVRRRRLPRALALACVALGLAGVALVVTHGDPGALGRGGAGLGELLVLAGATCWVLYTLRAAAFTGWSSLRVTALTSAWSLPSLALAEAGALALGAARWPSAADLVATAPALAYLVPLASVAAVLGWNAGIRTIGAVRGVLFINLVPVVAFAIAILGGRAAQPAELAGVALVIGALLLNSLATSPPAAPRALPAAAAHGS